MLRTVAVVLIEGRGGEGGSSSSSRDSLASRPHTRHSTPSRRATTATAERALASTRRVSTSRPAPLDDADDDDDAAPPPVVVRRRTYLEDVDLPRQLAHRELERRRRAARVAREVVLTMTARSTRSRCL